MRLISTLVLFVASSVLCAQPVPSSLEELLELLRGGQLSGICETMPPLQSESLTSEECLSRGEVCVRIRNVSELNFDSFEVHFSRQIEQFGVLASGETTEYREVACAHMSNGAIGVAAERTFAQGFIDQTGDAFLPPGLYTLNYRVEEFDEPRSNGQLHGYLRDELDVGEADQ